MIEGGSIYLVRTNHIGRPVFATTTTGTQVWSASYLPFGGVRTATGALPTPRFPGQWFQSESGLHQNWMRDYDPTTGRYIQADPLGLVDGASVYGYVRQNPGRFIDPRGEDAAALGTAIVRGVTMFGGTAAATIGGGIVGFLGILLYPSTLGDGTIPQTQDAAGDEPQQCTQCPACRSGSTGQVVPVGSSGHRYEPHSRAHWPYTDGEHVHLYVAQQNPTTCQCFWKAKQKKPVDPPTPPGSLDITQHPLVLLWGQ